MRVVYETTADGVKGEYLVEWKWNPEAPWNRMKRTFNTFEAAQRMADGWATDGHDARVVQRVKS